MNIRPTWHRAAAGCCALMLLFTAAGVAGATESDDISVALAAVSRGADAARRQRVDAGAGTADARLTLALASISDLVAERMAADPSIDTGDALDLLVTEVPADGATEGHLGAALDEVKLTGRALAEERSDGAAAGRSDERSGAAGGNGGNGKAGGNPNRAGGAANAGGDPSADNAKSADKSPPED